jgi:hypothetical protein
MKDPEKIKSFYSDLNFKEKSKKSQSRDFLPALEYCGWINDKETRDKVQECYPNCCFNHRVGLPTVKYRDKLTGEERVSKPVELYEYEKRMIEQYESHYFYAQNKVRGAGATEILAVRHLAYKYAVTNLIYGRKGIIIAGINQSLAIIMLRRIINLLEPVDFVYAVMPAQTSPTRLVFRTGGEILALSADPDAARGFENVGDVILEEAAFWGLIEDELVLKAVEPFVSKSGAHIGILSTPNGQRGFFYEKIFNPELLHTKYHRHTVTLEEIKNVPIPLLDIDEVERLSTIDPDLFAQEFNNKFILPSSSVFGSNFTTEEYEAEF